MKKWYYNSDGETFGPVVSTDIHQLLEVGKISHDDMICPVGAETWEPIREIHEFRPDRRPPPAIRESQMALAQDPAAPAVHAPAVEKRVVYLLELGERKTSIAQEMQKDYGLSRVQARAVVIQFLGKRQLNFRIAGAAHLIGGLTLGGIGFAFSSGMTQAFSGIGATILFYLLFIVGAIEVLNGVGRVILGDWHFELYVRIVFRIIIVSLAVGVFYLTSMGSKEVISPFLQAQKSTGWEKADCKILSASITRGGTKQKPVYTPAVNYVYKVKGKRYRGTRLSFFKLGYSKRGDAEKVLRNYRKHMITHAYYDPEKPKRVVLIVGIDVMTGRDWGMLFLLLGMGIFGLGLLCYAPFANTRHLIRTAKLFMVRK